MTYFSARLPVLYPTDAEALFMALEDHGVPYALLNGTKDVWVRDFMPVRTRSGRMISFRYEPSYLTDVPKLRTDFRRDLTLWLTPDPIYSAINLDGGNVVLSPSGRRALVSDRAFAENPDCERQELVKKLSELLEAEVFIIPSLRSDMTGHADGMARFLDDHTVVCNRPLSPCGFEKAVCAALRHHGLDVVEFPFFTAAGHSAAGCYLNYLETKQAIFLPVFGSAQDTEAVTAAKRLFSNPVVPVMMPNIAANGGGLHCISWEYDIEPRIGDKQSLCNGMPLLEHRGRHQTKEAGTAR